MCCFDVPQIGCLAFEYATRSLSDAPAVFRLISEVPLRPLTGTDPAYPCRSPPSVALPAQIVLAIASTLSYVDMFSIIMLNYSIAQISIWIWSNSLYNSREIKPTLPKSLFNNYYSTNQFKSNQINCWFLVRGRAENRRTRRKTSHSRVENQQTRSTYDGECGNRARPHWWKASALTRQTLAPGWLSRLMAPTLTFTLARTPGLPLCGLFSSGVASFGIVSRFRRLFHRSTYQSSGLHVIAMVFYDLICWALQCPRVPGAKKD